MNGVIKGVVDIRTAPSFDGGNPVSNALPVCSQVLQPLRLICEGKQGHLVIRLKL